MKVSNNERARCCSDLPVLMRKTKTPCGILDFLLCEKHKDLEYFIRYAVYEEAVIQ